MGKVHIHVHKRTADAQLDPKQREIAIKDFLIKTETKNRADAESYLVAKGWDLDRAVQAWERADRTHDLAANKSGKPATDIERRNCIMEVAKQGDCTNATAENYLCLNDWNVQRSVTDILRDRKQGFVFDSKMTDAVRDAEGDLDKQVRSAYKKLTDEFAASGGNRHARGFASARSEFIKVNYKYKESVGSWHPLAREMD